MINHTTRRLDYLLTQRNQCAVELDQSLRREKIACPFASALVFPQVEIVKVLSIIKKDLQVSTLDNGYKAVMKLGMPATSELLSGKPIAKVQMKTELFI